MAQLFISYSTRNADFARYLRGLLQDAGFDVWMDETKLSAGQSWTDTLEANVTNCSAFVIIMSPESKASDWVRRERLLAEKLHKPMFPILLAGEAWWDLANIQYEDMRAGVKASLSPRMIEALRRAISGEAGVTEVTSTGTHMPVTAPTVAQTDSRKLEAAMPAETKAGSDTEVWAKVSLPSSEGLRGELPVVVPSGDVIQKGDARASSFPVRFPIDARTGQRMPIQAELRLSAGDFLIAAPGERIEVEIPPDSDSRTVVFTLEAKPQAKTSGRSRIVIDLIYEAKIIAQISVSTVLVERVTAAVATWNLAAANYAVPGASEIAFGTTTTSESTLRDAPSAQPTVETASSDRREQREEPDRSAVAPDDVLRNASSSQLPADESPSDSDGMSPAELIALMESVLKQQGALEGFITGAGTDSAEAESDAAASDEVLPTYDEKAKKIAPADDYTPQPATPAASSPQYSGSAERSPVGAPQGQPFVTAPEYIEPMPGRAPRRASNTPLRLASAFAALALVFVVMLAITRQNVVTLVTATQVTQFALLPTDTFHAQAATVVSTDFAPTQIDTGDTPSAIAVAPMVGCTGSPGAELVTLLKGTRVDAILLDNGVTSAAEARRSSDSPVIVWGMCQRDTLTINFELVSALMVSASAGFTAVTTTTPLEALSQRDSRVVRLAQALTQYASSNANYTALAQTFEDLGASAYDSAERNALRSLQSNSVYLAGINSAPTAAR